MNGAEKILKAMKQINNAGKSAVSDVVTLTVKSKNPLVFRVENRLDIDKNFYELSKMEDWSQVNVGDTVRAFKMNGGQSYYINEILSGQNGSDNIKAMQEKIADLERRVAALEAR